MDNDGRVCWLNLWILICINRTMNGGVYMWGKSVGRHYGYYGFKIVTLVIKIEGGWLRDFLMCSNSS